MKCIQKMQKQGRLIRMRRAQSSPFLSEYNSFKRSLLGNWINADKTKNKRSMYVIR